MAADAATPYVLVHGFADSADTWGPLVPYLTDAEVHAWDLPGHGKRRQLASPDSPSSRDDALGELVDRIAALGVGVALVGHSLGGYLALMAAIDRPDLVASIALVSSGPGFRNAEARASWNAYIDSVAAKTDMLSAAAMAYQPDSYVIDNLAALQCPLVHVIGSRDRRYRAGAEYVCKVLPDSVLVEIDGAGHHPQRSHPEEVAAAIRAGRE